MYKTQMKAQKILCLLAMVMAVILFLYALGIMTDLYDSLYSTLSIRVVENKETGGYSISAKDRQVPGATVYTNMQAFNQVFVKYAIAYIVIAALLFVTNTGTRRRYYVSNYVAVGLFTAASIYIPIFASPYIQIFKGQFLQVDFAALKEYSETFGSHYTESTMWFDLQYVVFALMIVSALLLVACTVWKVILMKQEKKLVAEGGKA